MMLLLFTVGEDRFGLEARHIVEVVPYVVLNRLVGMPECVTGLFNYRREVVPVIDLSQMLTGVPARRNLSTRIILVKYPVDEGRHRTVGLLAERATETVKYPPSAFSAAGAGVRNERFVSSLIMDEKGMVQCVQLERLLPREVSEALLFADGHPQGGGKDPT
jgi:chemotaxis-related protein WspB